MFLSHDDWTYSEADGLDKSNCEYPENVSTQKR